MRRRVTSCSLVLALLPVALHGQTTVRVGFNATIPPMVVVAAVSELRPAGQSGADSLYTLEVQVKANAPYSLRFAGGTELRGLDVLGADGAFHSAASVDGVVVAGGGRTNGRWTRVLCRQRPGSVRGALRLASAHVVATPVSQDDGTARVYASNGNAETMGAR